MADHFTYDSAIVGSSMTENFRSSWFKDTGYQTVKMSYSGAHTSDLHTILDRVFTSDNDIKFVMIDLNDFQLTTDASLQYTEYPQYLYEDYWWDDTQYLWNKDVFWSSMGIILSYITNYHMDIDDSYTWEDPSLFSKDKVKESCRGYIESDRMQMMNNTMDEYDGKQEQEYCLDNIRNLTSEIESHPETEFIFYYPPYSILYWEEQVLTGRLDSILSVYQLSMEYLLQYDNVRVFYFQDEEELITDLNNYRDVCHHTPSMNRYIFDCIIIEDKNEVLNENDIKARIENMRRLATQYNYDVIWSEE